MIYLCDKYRHLICYPYSVDNLHAMAKDLRIKRCWFRVGGRLRHPHYDIPKSRISEITTKCRIINQRSIIRIIQGDIYYICPGSGIDQFRHAIKPRSYEIKDHH